MKNLIKAVLNVMDEVKSIDKNMNIGQGQYQYKGVADKDVKQMIGASMHKNGLVILPIKVDAITKIDRWEENDKQKQSVFVEVQTKYLLCHESGEQIEIAGYGHGVDSQDKACGKATTYALKYALLYTFMVATGNIDDADKTHSEEISVPKQKNEAKAEPNKNEPEKWLNKFTSKDSSVLTPEWNNIIDGIHKGTVKSVNDVRKVYKVNNILALEITKEIEKQGEDAPF